MNNERFMVPEVLFHPSDIGMQQAGAQTFLIDTLVLGHPTGLLLSTNGCPTQALLRRSCAPWRAAIRICMA